MSLLLLFPSLSLVESLFLPHVEVRSCGSVYQLYSRSSILESLLDLPGDGSLDGQVRVDTVDLFVSNQVISRREGRTRWKPFKFL